jgi:hypothetical protein
MKIRIDELKGKIAVNKKLLTISMLLVAVVLTGSAYGLVQLTKTKPVTIVTAPVKVKTSAKKATAPVAQTAAPASNTQTVVTPTNTPSTSTTPSSTSADKIADCNSVSSGEQSIASGLYNVGITNRNGDISVIDGYISDLPSLEAAYNSDPTAGAQQNINSNIAVTQNLISSDNGDIQHTNGQIIQAYTTYTGDVSVQCPTLTLAPEYQLVPSLPSYTAGSSWNP